MVNKGAYIFLCMQVDYIIVGFGISGIAITYQLQNQGKSVLVIDGIDGKASLVAAGLYNPVILKRFTLAWGAQNQMDFAKHFYEDLSTYLGIPTTQELTVFRKFNDPQEQNKWFSKVDNPQLKPYLSSTLSNSPSKALNSDYKFGKVKQTGRVLVADIIKVYFNQLLNKNSLLQEEFNYSKLKITETGFSYNNVSAKAIIFCEGYKMKFNPYFKELPLVGNKGSYLIVKSIDLKLNVAVKAYYFIIPLGNDLYKFGATYGHRFTKDHDKEAKQELISKLDVMINVAYEIIDFVVGVRPTVVDRKPLLGEHQHIKNMYLMNGMGTRGVLLAPTASYHLKNLILDNVKLPAEMDIKRFS